MQNDASIYERMYDLKAVLAKVMRLVGALLSIKWQAPTEELRNEIAQAVFQSMGRGEALVYGWEHSNPFAAWPIGHGRDEAANCLSRTAMFLKQIVLSIWGSCSVNIAWSEQVALSRS